MTDAAVILTRNRSSRLMLWIAMGCMVMLFAGLTSAYIISRSGGTWVKFELPTVFWISTGIIIISSITMNLALQASKRNNLGVINRYLFITLFLGIAFLISQVFAWNELVTKGIFFVGNVSGSYVYVLSGLHVVHVAGGLIFLLVVFIRSLMNRYSVTSNNDIYLCSVYWHFLDFLWLYLFVFLLLIR